MGSQRFRHDLATKQQQYKKIYVQYGKYFNQFYTKNLKFSGKLHDYEMKYNCSN